MIVLTLEGTIGPIFAELMKIVSGSIKEFGCPNHFQTIITGNKLTIILDSGSFPLRYRIKETFSTDQKAAEGRCMKVNGKATPHWEGKL